MTKRDFNDPVYKSWRTKVYKRDKFTCQMPGCKKKKYLNAHHIQKWASASTLRFDIDNGITLCYGCHKKVTGHEQHYQILFQNIVRNNNA
jgi:5-methylcytosine-specific restriction endonuclease McrA